MVYLFDRFNRDDGYSPRGRGVRPRGDYGRDRDDYYEDRGGRWSPDGKSFRILYMNVILLSFIELQREYNSVYDNVLQIARPAGVSLVTENTRLLRSARVHLLAHPDARRPRLQLALATRHRPPKQLTIDDLEDNYVTAIIIPVYNKNPSTVYSFFFLISFKCFTRTVLCTP